MKLQFYYPVGVAGPLARIIDGYVQCRIIQRADDSLLVEVPSADVVHVPKDAVLELEA